MKKKNILIVIAVLIILLISVVAVTYAYYVVGVSNANKQTASITTGTMSLTFSDNDNGFGGSINFGDTITKKFTIKNTGTLDASAQMNWLNIINTYLDGSLVYTLEYSESLNGTYTKIIDNQNVPRSASKDTIVLAPEITVPAGKTYYYNLKVTLVETDENQTSDLSASFFTQFSLSKPKQKTESEKTLTALSLTSKAGIPDFATTATIDETVDGLYSMETDYGTSYYFRGAVTNNYVKFGKWGQWYKGFFNSYQTNSYKFYHSLEECQNAARYNVNCTLNSNAGKDMYWRIVRINGDGSLRIIYDGTSAHANGESSADRLLDYVSFNSMTSDNAYVGYMYGLTGATTDVNRCLALENDTVTDKISTYGNKTSCEAAGGKWTTTAYEATHANVKSSDIKEYLDNWYKYNLLSDYDKYISDEIFCNDRSKASELGIWNSTDTSLGYGTNKTYYGAYNRLEKNKSPILSCPQKNDAFTVNDTEKGNGSLTYPIGLITADEVVVAGGKEGIENSNYYLNKTNYYWTLSPLGYLNEAYTKYIFDDGQLSSHRSSSSFYTVPVINLSKETAKQLIGTGIASDPFRLE